MNILSFDVEEWYIEKKFNGGRKEKYKEFDNYLERILDVLDEDSVKATFFCLGKIAIYFPHVIKKIYERGHEIGCHSNEHLWLSKMSYSELVNDTHNAISALEDLTGSKVVSYRAPAFSIGENNKWALEVLVNEGIELDASIFPAYRDFGGFVNFPTDSPSIVEYNGIMLKEFPICLAEIFGRYIAYSGGGYFRFFPYYFINNRIKASDYAMCYFHIGDLIHKNDGIMTREEYETYFREKGTLKNRISRHLKSSFGTKNAFDKMCKLIKEHSFVSVKTADNIIDWKSKAKIVL